MSKESRTPSPKTGDVRNMFPEDKNVIVKMSEDFLIKESGAVVRNNPHLHPSTDNNIKDRTDDNDSYLLI